MRYLVTGATGFLGRNLVRALQAEGHQIEALVRDVGGASDLANSGVKLHTGDITDRASVAAAVTSVDGARVDGVLHLAAWYKVGQRNPQAHAINVEGTRNVVEEAWRAGVARIVYTSTLAVNSDTEGRIVDESYRFKGKHISEYDRTKWIAHYEVVETLAAAGAPVVTVQPGVIYGAGDRSGVGGLIRSWLSGRPTPYCTTAAYCWGHVADTARAHILAMTRGLPGESYMICGPPHSLREAFEIASRVVGRPPPKIRLSASALKLGSSVLSVLSNAIPPLRGQAELLRTAPATYLGDSSKAQREIGFEARNLETGFGEVLPRLAADPSE